MENRGATNEQERDGLEAAVENAPSPVMRTIAKLALEKGHTHGSLARALNAQDGTALESTNVRSHFRSSRPHDVTIEAYSRVLGSSANEIRIISGVSPLPADQVDGEIEKLKKSLMWYVGDLEEETVYEACSFVDRADPATRARIATHWYRFTRENLHLLHGDEIVQALKGHLFLRSRPRVAGETLLRAIFDMTSPYVGKDGAESVVALTIGLLRRRGVDTAPYEQRFAIERAAIDAIDQKGGLIP